MRAIEEVKTETASPISIRMEEVARACMGERTKRDYRIRKESKPLNISEEDVISAYINRPHKQNLAYP
jgi:hypothetical protein